MAAVTAIDDHIVCIIQRAAGERATLEGNTSGSMGDQP
jgi:hypothetical protein